MSRELLYSLAGSRSSLLSHWLEKNPENPRIAWYPSAGSDVQDLLFLHPKYREINAPRGFEPASPSFFLHTDYSMLENPHFFDTIQLYSDAYTDIVVTEIEELPRLQLPVYADLVVFPKESEATHRVVFLIASVKCHRLGEFQYPILYVFSENAAFCAKCLRPWKARISHIVQVDYGNLGLLSAPSWIPYQFQRLEVEAFITDWFPPRPYFYPSHYAEDTVFYRFPTLKAPKPNSSSWKKIRTLPGGLWHGRRQVSWQIRPGIAPV